MAMPPSPTAAAAAQRLTAPERTSPAANTPGREWNRLYDHAEGPVSLSLRIKDACDCLCPFLLTVFISP